ncbi:MAG: tRNA lysidine(34) synthetase TilS [Candidatus Melainabacteria bacterium GWF2_37_15]|nr:MAG: tRNA lysidine(34) synthetase TilS [Candidatus Melainabacteria bacterium GWF2_37_15]
MKETSGKIKENTINFLKKYSLFDKNNVLLVGFSGGPDSLCLLDVLFQLGLKPVAAHLNHNWRPEEALVEQEKARQYCNERNIEFYTETLPPGLPQTEEEARNQRYSFFNRITEKIHATAILTGHTATDNVETILYRIIKGTGITGLKGIPEKREQIYRPLLNITRDECNAYCDENALSPSIDSSNYNQKYLRNRLRLSLLPEMRTYNPEVDTSLLRLSEIAREADEIIQECVKKTGILNNVIKTQDFLNLSQPLQKRVLADYFTQNDIEYTFERINDLFCFIQENKQSKSGKTFTIGKNLWFFVSSKEMKLINKEPLAEFPELKIKEWKDGVPEKFPEEAAHTIFADLSRVKQPIYLRTRKPGDIIQPFGMKEKTKLKKYLINRGIPQYQRDNIPLLVDDEEILWVVGIGMSELLRVEKIPTHVITVN